ncbi:hypothetical protein D3C86_1716050 [compost metagenome]
MIYNSEHYIAKGVYRLTKKQNESNQTPESNMIQPYDLTGYQQINVVRSLIKTLLIILVTVIILAIVGYNLMNAAMAQWSLT